MNISSNETNAPIPGPSDELLDELDDVILRMGRLMSSRHGGPHSCSDSITLPQAMMLRSMESHGAVKMSEVAALLAIKPPAASAAVDSLEREGYVQRAIDPTDRRVTLVTPTAEGLEALHASETQRRNVMRQHLSALSEDEIRSLISITTKLVEAMALTTE